MFTHTFWKRRWVEAMLVIFLCVGLLWWNPVSFFTPLRTAIWVAARPIVSFFASVQSVASDSLWFFRSLRNLKEENKKLFSEVVELRGQLAELQDIQKENEQIRKEIDAASRQRSRFATGLVIGYDSRGSGDWIIINKGKNNGISDNMAVVYGENILVGTVEEALASVSRVRLITHPKSAFAVRTVETQAKGVIQGKFGLGVFLDSVLQTETLREGDAVVTSELGENAPPGLYVGTIKDIGSSSDGLFQQATVDLPVDFFSMKTVSVVR